MSQTSLGDILEALNDKMDKDGENASISFLNQNIMTNCITEMPQNINIEVDTSVPRLTLKAGSKVYVPNGFEQDGTTPKFDERTISSNISTTFGAGNNTLFFVTHNGGLDVLIRDYCYSGETAPTVFQQGLYAIWYDTVNNMVKRTADAGVTWTSGYSLSICSGTADDIYQTFNGFGFIGLMIFSLPGIKGLTPNGRNADGTIKSYTFQTSKILTSTKTSDGNYLIMLETNYLSTGGNNTTVYKYNEDTNLNYWYGNRSYAAQVGTFIISGGIISEFNTKKAFRSVDYSEADYVVAYQRPTASNNYTWYRKYKSGWVEQGGESVVAGTAVTLPVKMANEYYYASCLSKTIDPQAVEMHLNTRTTTTVLFTCSFNGNNNYTGETCVWEVKGMAA